MKNKDLTSVKLAKNHNLNGKIYLKGQEITVPKEVLKQLEKLNKIDYGTIKKPVAKKQTAKKKTNNKGAK